jgi:hypothetical protein
VGVRVNKFWRIREWLPAIAAIRPLLREAAADTDSGLLGYRVQFAWPREVIVIQYWRNPDVLLEFAERPRHRAAWRDFYRLATVAGAVGLWHELYAVPAGRYEAIYGIVPPVGLASFSLLKPVGRRDDGARARLRHETPQFDSHSE